MPDLAERVNQELVLMRVLEKALHAPSSVAWEISVLGRRAPASIVESEDGLSFEAVFADIHCPPGSVMSLLADGELRIMRALNYENERPATVLVSMVVHVKRQPASA